MNQFPDLVNTKDLQYLALCDAGAQLFATCGKRQYMSIVLDEDGRVTGMGYNGSAPGTPHCKDGACPRWGHDSAPGSSYDNCISIHAEQNALMYSGRRHTIYVNGQPCMTCAKLISGSGVVRVVGIADPSYAMSDDINDLLRVSGLHVALAELETFRSFAEGFSKIKVLGAVAQG